MNVKETMIANNKVTCAKMENVYLMNLLIWDIGVNLTKIVEMTI